MIFYPFAKVYSRQTIDWTKITKVIVAIAKKNEYNSQ